MLVQFLHGFDFFFCHGHVGVDELIEQLIDVVFGFCHASGKGVVGVGVVAQQLCFGSVKVDYLFDDVDIVGIARVGAEGVVCPVHLFAELTA